MRAEPITTILFFVILTFDSIGIVNAFSPIHSSSTRVAYSRSVSSLDQQQHESSQYQRHQHKLLSAKSGGRRQVPRQNQPHQQQQLDIRRWFRPITVPGVFRRNSATYAPMSENDPVLREFQVKEAAIERKRERAAAMLAEYETSLQQLQSKKQQYMAASQLPDNPVGGQFSETAIRSAVKAFVWRLLAGSITFMTTLKFSGSLSQAFQVVSADFLSKVFTMFIGERIMNKSQAGRQKGGDGASRSLVKAIVWRLFAVSNTLAMAIFISKDLSIASKIASTDAVFKTSLMYFYERAWAKIDWGKEYLIEFSI